MRVKPGYLWSVLFAVLLMASTPGHAIDDLAPLPSAELQARYDRLTEELRCVKCQNQNIADSNAGIARDLRVKVHEMLIAGRTDAQILDYMVARYGEFVLYRPPFKPSTWLLWLAPFLLLGAGGLLVVNTVRSRARMYDPDAPDDEPQALVEERDADERHGAAPRGDSPATSPASAGPGSSPA